MSVYGISEADESAASKEIALANFQFQIEQGETMGVIQMYEDAAIRAGASWVEIKEARKRAKLWTLDLLKLLTEYARLCNLDRSSLKRHIERDPLGEQQFFQWASCLPNK